MTDFYFHEKVKSIQNLPISCLVEEGLRSLPAKRILVNQVFSDFERRNAILIFISYGQENPICSVYSGGRASFMVIVHFCNSTTEVCFSLLVVEPSKF